MHRFLACLVLILVAWPIAGRAASPEDQAALTSTWHGTWTASGFIYEAEVHLTVDQINGADGYIKWVLRQSPRPEEKDKIGLGGTEYVRGTYLSAARLLRIDGYKLDNANSVIGLDKYRLILSDDTKILGGITWNHGSWLGQLLLTR
jgi:hypothetical protein